MSAPFQSSDQDHGSNNPQEPGTPLDLINNDHSMMISPPRNPASNEARSNQDKLALTAQRKLIDSEPYYDDGPQRRDIHETKVDWINRVQRARNAMGIQRKPRYGDLPQRGSRESNFNYLRRRRNYYNTRHKTDEAHQQKMDVGSKAYDEAYRTKFLADKRTRYAHNTAARARQLQARRDYDAQHHRQRAPTPLSVDDSDDGNAYDQEITLTGVTAEGLERVANTARILLLASDSHARRPPTTTR